MHAFARELAALLVVGAQTHEAMVARLADAYGGERSWMPRLARLVLWGPYDDEEDEDEDEHDADDRDAVDQYAEIHHTNDRAPSVQDRSASRNRDLELDELAAWLVELPAFHTAILERPLARRWSEAPAMRESPWRVPALATNKELAVWLGTSVDALTALADVRNISRSARKQRRRHYRYTWIAKQHGYRLLEAPKPRLRQLQRYVLDGIIARIPPHAAAHGFRTGHSIATAAAAHVGREVVIRLDLRAFFTSVSGAQVAAIFRTAGYPAAVAQTLAALCTHRTPSDVIRCRPRGPRIGSPLDVAAPLDPRSRAMGSPPDVRADDARLRRRHLPQGAPSSGALANLAAHRFDVRLHALAVSLGATYTRYADDIAISGSRDLARNAPTIIARAGAIAIEQGFELNFRKTRVMTAGKRQLLTGLVVNDKLAVPRADVEQLRAILHNCARTGPAAQNRDDHPDFRAHLLGRIGWVASIDAGKGARLRSIFDRIVWPD